MAKLDMDKLKRDKLIGYVSLIIGLIVILSSLVLSLVFCGSHMSVRAEVAARIWTDKGDYNPEQTVVIYGAFFSPNAQISISVMRPNGWIDNWCVYSDPEGDFETSYRLDGITGTYAVNVTDGTNTATMTFTDSPGLALDGFGKDNETGDNSLSISLSTSQNDVLYVTVVEDNSRTVSSITDNLGSPLTWNKRDNVNIGSGYRLETWYAVWYSTGSITIKLNFSGRCDAAGEAFGISGANLSAPFDVAPTHQTSRSTYASTTITTTQPNDFIIGVAAANDSTTLSAGSGYTQVTSQSQFHRSGGYYGEVYAEYRVVSTPQSNLSVRVNLSSYEYWAIIADAVKEGWSVTFSQTGLDNDASGTVLTVGSNTYTYDNFPSSPVWVDDNTIYSYTTDIPAGSGKHYVLENVTGDVSSPVHASGTATGNYVTQENVIQYELTMATNFGTTSPSVGSTLENAGTVLTISATAPSAENGERYVWNGWIGTGLGSYTGDNISATITMSDNITETASWTHQYMLTMGTDNGTTSPSAGDTWENAGTVLTISATAPSAVPGERYVWNGWTGSGTGSYTGTDNPATGKVTMSGPITENASWTYQQFKPLHATIYINGDDNFIPSNGVSSGSGTENDPYIIDNWAISAENAEGIAVVGTTKYFIIRNCLIEGGGYSHDGIHLENVINGTIENNTCNTSHEGVVLISSPYCNVTGNLFDNNVDCGIQLWASSYDNITGNTCENSHADENNYGGFGIAVENGSEYNTLTNNNCSNNSYGILVYPMISYSPTANTVINNTCNNNSFYGIYLDNASNDNLTSNTCENNNIGIYLYNSSDNNILDNNICKGDNEGIQLDYSQYNILSNNTCSNNYDCGIIIYHSSYDDLTSNTCENNYYGIFMQGSSGNVLTLNYLLANFKNGRDDNTANAWDNNGKGNYWDNWQPPTYLHTNGIISTPRPIEGGSNYDNYPLVISYVSPSPISINGDTGFIPQEGVIGGTGTALDPYIISGWTINAPISYGISIQNTTSYFIIQNCLVENSGYPYSGIFLDNVINGVIENNTCENNYEYGIYLSSSSYDNVIGNTCVTTVNEGGIRTLLSNYNNITGNICENNNYEGIQLDNSNNNSITNNICDNNWDGIWLDNKSCNNSVTYNTCNNNRHHGLALEFFADNNIISNNIVENNHSDNASNGIYLVVSSNNTIKNNICGNNGPSGIFLGTSSLYPSASSDNNIIDNNTCENNDNYGIFLGSGHYNTLSNNICNNNLLIGIWLYQENNGIIKNNTCENNYYGIYIDRAHHNILSNNTCENNYYGIYSYFSSYDNLTSNTCENDNYGIYLSGSSNNILTLNYLLANLTNGRDNSTNAWDNNGKGNYWDNWQPPDHPDNNHDGVVDTVYVIPGGISQDNYPLVIGPLNKLTMVTNFGTTSPSAGDTWYDVGTVLTISATAPSAGAGERYVWNGWTGSGTGSYTGENQSAQVTMSDNITETASWTHQYYLTVVTSPSGVNSPTGEGWYDVGTSAPRSTDNLDNIVSGTSRYRFNGWTTDNMDEIADASSLSTTVTMDNAKTVTANYLVQYYLTVTSLYDTSAPSSGWFDNGTSITENVTSPMSGGPGIQYVCTGWSGTGSVPTSGTVTSVTFTITALSSIAWNWKTQYYLTVTSPYGTTGGDGWYDNGATANATVTPLTVPGLTGVQYVFKNWSVDATGTISPSDPITMNAPKTATAVWKTQYYPPVVTSPDFNLSPSPTFGSVVQGGSVTATISVSTTVGFAETVNLSATDLPSGATVIFSPSSGAPGFSSTMTISTITTTPTGVHMITVIGAGGGKENFTTFTLTVTALVKPAEFKLDDLRISPIKVEVGKPVTITVTVRNAGDASGTYTVVLKVNGAVENTKDATLQGGASESVAFTIVKNVSGTYSVEVDGLTGTFSIVTPPIGVALPILIGAVIAIIAIGATIIVGQKLQAGRKSHTRRPHQ